MIHKLRPSPSAGTGEPLARAAAAWLESSSPNLVRMRLFRSWLVYDSAVAATAQSRLNWNFLWGLAFAAIVSASGWICLGLLIARLYKWVS
jgi:hypothetical protein